MNDKNVPPLKERFLAFCVDLGIAASLCLIPKVGWMFGLIYFLGRDAMPSLKGQSAGKKIFNIRILDQGTNEPLYLHPRSSITRGLILLIPVVNIIDIYLLIKTGRRLADKWTETYVIKEED
ncbi:MAG: RDD family protein [Chlorobi bacterium]|nr:RDD family protein [Chlorobiota bacterium]